MPEVYGSASRCFEHRWKVGEGVTNASGESALIPGESGDGVTNASGESALIPGESGDGVTNASVESALIPGESGDGVMSASGESALIPVMVGLLERVWWVGQWAGPAATQTFAFPRFGELSSATRESVVVQVGRSEVTCSQAGEKLTKHYKF